MRMFDSGKIGKGFLSFENFKKFVDNNPKINLIELSNSGEIFLNPQLDKIIEYAYKKRVRLEARGGVNFNNVSDEMLELLVKYRFNHINIAIDGASQETYSKYRVNGDFDKVISNIKKLNALKAKYKSVHPRLCWQFIIMDTNKDDVKKARTLAKDLHMQFKTKLDWSTPKKDKQEKDTETSKNLPTREHYEKKHKKPYRLQACQQIVNSPQINWDGRLLGCCCNFLEDYDVNVFEVGLEQALNTEKYLKSKQMLLGKIPQDNNSPCAKCNKYLYLKRHNKNITFNILQDWLFRKIYRILH